MAALFSTPKAPQPSAAQLAAQEAQTRSIERQERDIANAEAAALAARRARGGTGRIQLLNDEVGTGPTKGALQSKLGGA